MEWKFYNICVVTGEDSAKASSLFGAINETVLAWIMLKVLA